MKKTENRYTHTYRSIKKYLPPVLRKQFESLVLSSIDLGWALKIGDSVGYNILSKEAREAIESVQRPYENRKRIK